MEDKIFSKNLGKEIIIATVSSVIAALVAGIGGFVFGQNTNTYIYNGHKVTEEELSQMISKAEDALYYKGQYDLLVADNQALQDKVTSLESSNSTYETELKELQDRVSISEAQLSDMPQFEFQDLGLTVYGDEQQIDKNKSLAKIDGQMYFSQDVVESIINDKNELTIKDDMLYVGRVIKDKEKLNNLWVVQQVRAKIESNIKDSFGNFYTNEMVLYSSNAEVTFNINNDYDLLKLKIAITEGTYPNSNATVYIYADDANIKTVENLNKLTEPIILNELPLNKASKLTLKISSNTVNTGIIVEGEVYN